MCEETKFPPRMSMEVVPQLIVAATKRRLILVLDTIFENEVVHFGGAKDKDISSQICTSSLNRRK